ncbi:MAG: Ig-like domain-containing protein [Gemmatimonadaceae bacterium]|nr:Ig-like domain-containing protein [Gemmatimonadaceae bacterium]
MLAACGDSPAKPIPVASVSVTPASVTLIAGATQQFTATVRDAKGAELTGRAISWTTTNGSVATISATGALATIAPGIATVQAISEGVTGTAAMTVLPVPVASVSVTLPSNTMVVGAVQQAVAVTRDAAGNVLTGRTITWSTSIPSIATVDASGRVTANAPGTVTIGATSESQIGGTALTVQAPAPTITSITPATLSPGGTATITGTGFDTSLGGASVSIRGAPAPIVTITSTQIVVTVPCVESGAADVRVSSLGATPATKAHPVATTQRTVAPGQALILASSTAAACNELVATGGPARYLIAVFSAATSQNTLNAFELAGNTPAAGGVRVVAASRAAPRASIEILSPDDARNSRREQQHFAMLERNRQDYERLMATMRVTPAAPRPSALAQRAAEVAVGDMKNVFFTFSGGCNDTTRVMRAKAIRVGTKSVIWEDSANVLQSSADAPLADFYSRIGQIFDQEQYASVRRSFADPLLRDSLTDGDGKIAMVFSERLNGSGAAAYVTSCDQFPGAVSKGSNFGQYFYGSVPTTAGSNVNSVSFPDGWFYFMTRTVVHEVKHIAALSARVANNAPSFEQSWLEEGTARHAEELWVRESMHHVPFKGNSGFGRASNNGMYCDFHPLDATCNAGDPLRRPSYGVRRQFNEIRNKLIEPWNWSPYGDGTGQSGSIFYQTTWSLVRYAADRYAASDSAFLQALTNATTTGVTNLTAVTGASLDQLIGGWGLALVADDYPGLVNPSPDIQFATWNLRDIYASLNAAPLWTARWNTPFPIAPTPLAYGAFVAQVPVIRGGAHAYFELTGAFTAPQLLNLRTNATTAPGTNLRIAITRLQ